MVFKLKLQPMVYSDINLGHYNQPFFFFRKGRIEIAETIAYIKCSFMTHVCLGVCICAYGTRL
jgi:hypothetical protein